MTNEYGFEIPLVSEEECKLQERIEELENKIADIKANCDLAIEGRDIKIKELELELTVEKDQHQEEINLHLHAEEYIKSLEQQIEKMKSDVRTNIKWADQKKNNQMYCKLNAMINQWEIKENG